MGAEAALPRLRAWSAARWVLVGAIGAVLGAGGWYFTMFDVYGLDDFGNSLAISMLAFPATVMLIVLDFRTVRQRGVLWTWIVLRAVAVPLLGLGMGSLVRVWIVTGGDDAVHGLFDSYASNYAWQLAGLGAALLAVQPLVGGVRRVAVAVFGAPQEAAAGGEISAEPAGTSRESSASARKWPGSSLAKAIAGTVGFAVIATGMLTFADRVHWHVAVETSSSVPPMVATGTLDGREIAVASYDERGAFMRMDDTTHADTWFVLDPRTGDIEATAEEGNLQVIDDPGDAAPGIPGDVVKRYLERNDQRIDDGYDYEFTDDADLERVFRYEDESLVIDPVTGRPAGEDHGFTLHQICCRPSALESHAEDGSVLWRIDGAVASPRHVVAVTESGRVVLIVEGPESKGRLIIARRDGFTETVIGDRGWFPW